MKKFIYFLVIIVILVGGLLLLLSPKEESVVTSNLDSISLEIGIEGQVNGVSIKPIEVTEDSRCPTEVQCVWAGRVVVKVALRNTANFVEEALSSEKPLLFNGKTIELVSVTPQAISGRKIEFSQYSFEVRVK